VGFLDSITSSIDAIGNAGDKLFTSDEERLAAEAKLREIAQQPDLRKFVLNQLDANSSSLFRSGWRPSIGWWCSFGVGYEYFICPILNGLGYHMPSLDSGALLTLLGIMLGNGGLRSFEKVKGVTR